MTYLSIRTACTVAINTRSPNTHNSVYIFIFNIHSSICRHTFKWILGHPNNSVCKVQTIFAICRYTHRHHMCMCHRKYVCVLTCIYTSTYIYTFISIYTSAFTFTIYNVFLCIDSRCIDLYWCASPKNPSSAASAAAPGIFMSCEPSRRRAWKWSGGPKRRRAAMAGLVWEVGNQPGWWS